VSDGSSDVCSSDLIQQDGPSYLPRQVVKVSDASERGLDTADDDRNVLEGFARTLRVDDYGAIRALAALTAWRICIIASNPTIRGVAVDHGVHVARGEAEKQVRPPKGGEGVRAGPGRLSDNAYAKPLCLQHAADDGHTEARMVHVGIAGDDDHVAAIPA